MEGKLNLKDINGNIWEYKSTLEQRKLIGGDFIKIILRKYESNSIYYVGIHIDRREFGTWPVLGLCSDKKQQIEFLLGLRDAFSNAAERLHDWYEDEVK